VGLDINASRAHAVQGPARAAPRLLPLGGPAAPTPASVGASARRGDDLPMVLSLQGRQAEVGKAGAALCRVMPHLVCADFLAAVVLDADDHALSAAVVVADGEQLSVHSAQCWPHLNLRVWNGCLVDAVADRCIRQSRRDPRDTAAAEQALYEQIDESLDSCGE